jgi:peptidoglycan hydrolase-like protein with peptidoglycan-binding domain
VADKDGNIKVGDSLYTRVHQSHTGDYVTDEKEGVSQKESQQTNWPTGLKKPSELTELKSREAITSLQTALKELYKNGTIGQDVGEIDGVNGPKTQAAMRAF